MRNKVFIIEYYTASPHFETSIEISIQAKKKGDDVIYNFLNIPFLILRIPKHLNLNFFKNYFYVLKESKQKIEILKKLFLFKIELKILSKINNPHIYLKCLHYSIFHPLDFNRLKKYEYDSINLGVGAVSTYVSLLGNDNPIITWRLVKLKKILFEAAYAFELTKKIISDQNPNLVITFNGRNNIDNAILKACKIHNIPVKVHERGATYEKYELFEPPLHSYTNVYKRMIDYWNESNLSENKKKEIATDFFTKIRNGVSIGWESFSSHFDDELNFNINNKKVITYFVGSDDELVCVELDEIDKQPLFETQKEAVRFLMDLISIKNDTELIIRVHPNISNKSKEQKEYWNNLKGKNVTLIKSDSKVNSYLLIEKSFCILTYGSTVGIEASFWNKPSILLGLSYYRSLNCTYSPSNLIELTDLLNSDNLLPFDNSNSYIYGYYFNSFGKNYEYYSPKNLFEGELLI